MKTYSERQHAQRNPSLTGDLGKRSNHLFLLMHSIADPGHGSQLGIRPLQTVTE